MRSISCLWTRHFALAALQGILASWSQGGHGRVFDFNVIAIDAYYAADAMLFQRRAYCPVCAQKIDPVKGFIVHESGCTYGWRDGEPTGVEL